MSKAEHDIRRKRPVLEYAKQVGNARKACRFFGISRASFYRWRQAFTRDGDAGLVAKRPVARWHPKTRRPEIVEQVLHLRRTYHLGPARIVWYLARYHSITICDATVYRILRRHGLRRLPNRVGRRAVHTHRYEKQVPGHHVQVDVKFLTLQGSSAANGCAATSTPPSMMPRAGIEFANGLPFVRQRLLDDHTGVTIQHRNRLLARV